ncbi:MAG: hypothetical protein ABFR65_14090 [Pseudomonadota bacterium]
MNLNLPIYTWGGISHPVKDRPPRLKPQIDATPFRLPRRSDRLTQLGLLGLSACAGTDRLADDTPLILATGEANLSSTIQINEQLFVDNRLPSPIGFINSVNNSAAFYLNQVLGTKGRTLTVSRDECSLEAAFQLAGIWQHEFHTPMLVGTVDEAPLDPELHKIRMQYPRETILGEGSYWFYCGSGQTDTRAIAAIGYCGSLGGSRAAIDCMQANDISHFILTESVDSRLLSPEKFPGEQLNLPSPGRFSTQSGYYLAKGLEKLTTGDRLCLINRKRRSCRISLTIIDRY